MTTVDPIALAVGTVREVTPSTFINRETGTVEDRGRKLTVLTSGGFLVISVPVEFNRVLFEEGKPAAIWFRIREWSFGGRTGTSFIFSNLADSPLAAVLTDEFVV